MTAYVELTKPGITRLIVLTAAAGFFLATPGHPDLLLLAHTLFGTALAAGGTNALNQWWEREADARMGRTRGRPLPSGRLSPARALAFAAGISAAGIGWLAWWVNGPTALLAALSLVLYIFAYTPLKRRTPVALLVGAVPGALPILGGWTAAGGALTPTAWALFGLLFFWQLPHFLALGWLHRDDYRAGGFAVLSGHDPAGHATGGQAVLWTLALGAVSLAPLRLGSAAVGYLVGAGLLGAAMLWGSGTLWYRPSERSARHLFVTSVIYLPALLALLVIAHIADGPGPP